ncbi:MAG: hypothetical protein OXU33_04860 [Gemmatimonadota bacterium]|nr:hypothetical protein [Gemmatimonadota bacterium]MDE3005487.1 hypothetical protein [Gemmatimonadota bacterium]MDE3013382.1 hypothetical protein [Gemmatimonadota bacterium]
MLPLRTRAVLLLTLVVMSACASAEDRLNQGVELQSQGRYVEAVYRYAEAIEKDSEILEARERMVAAGDSAVMLAMDEADDLERQGDPVAAAEHYQSIDQMLARIRQVGERLALPSDYSDIRRALFDAAIDWRMFEGDRAVSDGRWEDAVALYRGARGSFLPSRSQVDASYDAETRVLLDWAGVELEDARPRASYDLAQRALEVRDSPTRETVLSVRDVQEAALEEGTIVVAVVPVTADAGVRDWLGGEFEIALDSDLNRNHWTRPPLFVEMADPVILRTELRGLLRGQATQSPMLVGRALELIGADLGVMIRLSGIDVVEEDVDRGEYEAVVQRNIRQGARRTTVMDTVPYYTLEGTLTYHVESDITLVDAVGRVVNRFTASSRQSGPFMRGEFDGDPARLDLPSNREVFFDPTVIADQMRIIEGEVLDELAVAIAVGTFDQILAGVR